MPQLFALDAGAFLVADATSGSIILTVESGKADRFPVANAAGDWFKIAIKDQDGGVPEVCYVTTRTAGSNQLILASTADRGKENGAAARSWLTSKKAFVYMPLTDEDVKSALQGVGPKSGISSNAQNFNTLTTNGVYPLTGDGTWTGSSNGPTSAAANGQVQVFTSSTAVVQELATFNPVSTWRRSKTSITWSSWTRVDAAESLKNTVGAWINDADGAARLFFTNTGATIVRGYGAAPFSVQNASSGTIFLVSDTGVAASGADAVASGDLPRLGQVQTLIDSADGWYTGDFKDSARVSNHGPWLLCDDKTIGDASSNATSRANADTQDLFTLLWTVAADADVPIYTSAGARSTRGASAAADWAAHKAISVVDWRGLVAKATPNGGGNTTNPTRAHLSVELDVVKNHSHTFGYRTLVGAGSGIVNSDGSSGGITPTQSTIGGGNENLVRTRAANKFIHL